MRIFGPPVGNNRPPILRRPGRPGRPPRRTVCTDRNFTAKVRLKDRAGIKSVKVFIDGRRVKRVSLTRFSLHIQVRDLRVGRHQIKVVARDRAGNVSVTRRNFARCALRLAAPHFTG